MAKNRTDQLVERLHAAGLRKQVAKTLGRGTPKSRAQQTIDDIRSLVSEVESRLPGLGDGGKAKSASSRSRSEAAKKAAATRKRNAAAKSKAKSTAKPKSKAKPKAKSRS